MRPGVTGGGGLSAPRTRMPPSEIGPGCVIGNTIFGDPSGGVDAWMFGIPSIWAWQILWWVLGCYMMWFLAYKMEMSTVPSREVEALVDDIGDVAEGKAPLDADTSGN